MVNTDGRRVSRRNALIAGACYVALRVGIAAWVGPRMHFDTADYRDHPVDVFGRSIRPWVVSALLRLNDHTFVVVQAAVSAVAFLTLGVAIALTMRDQRVRVGVVVLLALLGLSPRVTAWDTLLLTESLAISLTAFLIACLIWINRVPWWVTGVVFTLWLFTRDAHLYVGLLVLVGAIAWGLRRRQWLLPVAMSLAFMWGVVAYRNNDVIEAWNVSDNIAMYAGADVETFKWFVAHDMPVSTGFYESDFDTRAKLLMTDTEFWKWAETDGQTVYAEYLVTHPRFLFGGLQYLIWNVPRESDTLLDHSTVTFRNDDGSTWRMPETFGPPVWPSRGSLYTACLLLAAVLGALLTVRNSGRLDQRWILPGVLTASTIPHALLTYHAAPTEWARHSVVMAFVLVVSCWWVIALAVDVALGGLDPAVRLGAGDERADLGRGTGFGDDERVRESPVEATEHGADASPVQL